jgi:hypothetical protein
MLNGIFSAFAGMFTGWALGAFMLWVRDKRKDKRDRKQERHNSLDNALGIALGGRNTTGVDHDATAKFKIGMIEAMNGKILEIATSSLHANSIGHYDWKIELYMVPEGQKVSEAIATVMLLKGLEN